MEPAKIQSEMNQLITKTGNTTGGYVEYCKSLYYETLEVLI